ncbi:MAG: hypothetical protein IPL61_37540 [Myxococcales bacterium]|nr:hypothetical protein [Myxococcales bacterium]
MSAKWMLVAAMVVSGCGGDGDSPVEQCDALLEVVCDRAAECVSGVVADECVQELQAQIPCGAVERVGPRYGRCMQQLREFSCAVLFPVDLGTGADALESPVECDDVFQAGSGGHGGTAVPSGGAARAPLASAAATVGEPER